ncbi:MAG: hypothetical protein IJ740_12940 [Ruminococcus sp.]|nr:hypothetical protein [Ruminococcus sp.]
MILVSAFTVFAIPAFPRTCGGDPIPSCSGTPEGTAAFKNRVDNPRKSGIIEIEEGSSSNDIEWLSKGERISTDEYKELRDYAASKGISLSGFRTSDVDTDLIRESINSITEVTAVFPELMGTGRKNLTLSLSYTMRANDFASSDMRISHIIELNGNAFRNAAKLEEEYQKLVKDRWFVQGTSRKSIVKHELGHLYQSIHGLSDKEVVDIALRASNLDSPMRLFDYLSDNLSLYSASYLDGSEIISEVFSDYFTNATPTDFSKKFIEELTKMR